MKMNCSKSLTMKVLLGLVVAGCFLPRQAAAQATDIHSFTSCVNVIGLAGGTVADAAASCIPSSGCYYTSTLSEESPQNGCTLRDGTRLPRVIFSCAGPGGSQTLRFRPSFSLCTLGNDFTSSVINHIEMGEDSTRVIDHSRVQKMGDIDMLNLLPEFATATSKGVVDTSSPKNDTGCSNCHDLLGNQFVSDPSAGSAFVNLFRPIRPELAEGTIDTTDPSVEKPLNPVPLSVICSGIQDSSQLKKNPDKRKLAQELCNALAAKAH
jgi:hypothetical protein